MAGFDPGLPAMVGGCRVEFAVPIPPLISGDIQIPRAVVILEVPFDKFAGFFRVMVAEWTALTWSMCGEPMGPYREAEARYWLDQLVKIETTGEGL